MAELEGSQFFPEDIKYYFSAFGLDERLLLSLYGDVQFRLLVTPAAAPKTSLQQNQNPGEAVGRQGQDSPQPGKFFPHFPQSTNVVYFSSGGQAKGAAGSSLADLTPPAAIRRPGG